MLASVIPPGTITTQQATTYSDNSKKSPLLLILGECDWAHVGHRLAEAVNKYTNWEARVIVERQVKEGFPVDILANQGNYALMSALFRSANYVLFISSHFKYRPLGLMLPHTTPKGLWHGGSLFRQNYSSYNQRVHPHFNHVFAHRDLISLGKNIDLLHAPYDTDKHKYEAKDFDGKIIIGHSPSIQGQKHSDIFMAAQEILQRKYGDKIGFDIMCGLPWNAVLERKKKIHIFFDQIAGYVIPPNATHGYGVSLLEAAAYGAVCLCGCDYRDTPIYTVRNANDIVKTVSNLMDCRQLLKERSLLTRAWVVREHGYKAVANDFINNIGTTHIDNTPLLKRIDDVFAFAVGGFRYRNCWVFDFYKGNPQPGLLNVAYVRDIPLLQQDKNNIGHIRFCTVMEENKIDKVDCVIVPSHRMGFFVQQYIFKGKEVPYYVYRNYPRYIHKTAAKRNEIVFIDNSSCNCDNYDRLLSLLNDINEATGVPVLFVSKKFATEAAALTQKYPAVKTMPLTEYDMNSKYGILLDGISSEYASFAMPRKFLQYLMLNMVPIIHTNFKECMEFLSGTDTKYIAYTNAADLKEKTDTDQVSDGRQYAFEYNYRTLLDILRGIDREISNDGISNYTVDIVENL